MTSKWIKSRWILGMVVCAVTAASYAQWTNPADDIPAYHPSAPLKVSALPPILRGAQLTGEHFRYPWQVHAYQQAIKIGNVDSGEINVCRRLPADSTNFTLVRDR